MAHTIADYRQDTGCLPDSGPQVFYLDDHPITATAVHQLYIRRETLHRVHLQPASSQSHVQSYIPENATTLIVKQRKEGWDKEFEDEQIAYQRLSSLQGELIPQFYGAGSFNGVPAIFISDIPGPTLRDYAFSTIHIEIQETGIRAELEKTMKALHDLGAEYWDQKLDNFIRLDCGRIVVLDLEQVGFPQKLDPWERNINKGGVGALMRNFNDIRAPEGQKSWDEDVFAPFYEQQEKDGKKTRDPILKRAPGRRYWHEEYPET